MPATTKSPVITFSLIGATVLVSASPVLTRWLVWDRVAIADGQWWRLVTGHLVHFTPRHLLWDVLAVGAAGWLIETRARKPLGFVILASALAISATVSLLCPAVRYYGGLSGVACAMCGYLAVIAIRAGAQVRWAGFTMLALLAGKIGLECATGRTLLAGGDYVVLPVVHAVGAMSGVLKGAMAA